MPELPEVETFVRQLQSAVGRTIVRADVLDDRLNLDPAPLVGARISAIRRRGKHIVFDLEERGDLVIHLRMSGRLRRPATESEKRYVRLTLHLDGGGTVDFVNPRRLGTAALYPQGFQSALGLEPLDADFTVGKLALLTGRSRSPIKTFLLDQRRIAGVGNIYAAEALWRAGIAPTRGASSLASDEIERLHEALRSVLNEAINGQGTSIGNGVSDYRSSDGEQGEFQNRLFVYGREAEPCARCGSTIVRTKQAGRSTYHCTQCQA